MPATGMRRHEMYAFAANVAPCPCTTAPLTEPTSETMAPGVRKARDFLRHRATGADRDAQDHEIGVLDGFRHWSPARHRPHAELASPGPGFPGGARGGDDFAVPVPCARAPRAIEPPISPKPISAILLNMRRGVHFARHEVAQALEPPADWLLRCRWSCAGHAAGRNFSIRAAPGRAWSGTHPHHPRCLPFSSGKWIRMKFATLGVTLRPSFVTSSVSQLRHLLGVRLWTSADAPYPRSPPPPPASPASRR